MAKSVRLDSEFVSLVEVHAAAGKRSVPKQIEHWAQIGRAAEENPELPYSSIKEALLATEQIKAGMVTPYEPRKIRSKNSSN